MANNSTISLARVNRFPSKQLKELTNYSYAELWWRKNTFCVLVQDAEKYSECFEEIIQHCDRIQCADHVEVYIAEKHYYYLFGYNHTLYCKFKELSNEENERYVDITEMGGKIIKNINAFNYVGKGLDVTESIRLPKLKKSRLFYSFSN